MNARVAIIGGGPAGSACAVGLVRAGMAAADVVVVEAKAFPRVKVCGEFVSPAATAILESIVPGEELAAAGARRVERLVLEVGEREVAWDMPTSAWTLSRASLDDLLMQRVRELGVRVEQPARVREVDYRDNGVTITLADNRVIEATIVVHADGSGKHDLAGAGPHRRGVVGMKCHFRPERAVEGIRMRSACGAYIGTVQVERGLATCALTCRSEEIATHGGNADALVHTAWPEWDSARRESEWLSCGVAGSGYIDPGHARSFRVGNAAAAVEPVGGEGIGLALWAGTTLGQKLGQNAITPDALARAQREFAQYYRQRIRTRRPACLLAAHALMRPWLVRAAMPLLAVPGVMIRPWYAMTGKPMRPIIDSPRPG